MADPPLTTPRNQIHLPSPHGGGVSQFVEGLRTQLSCPLGDHFREEFVLAVGILLLRGLSVLFFQLPLPLFPLPVADLFAKLAVEQQQHQARQLEGQKVPLQVPPH